ncbi:MAG: hypothetical protein ABIG10_01830 [bacterium]
MLNKIFRLFFPALSSEEIKKKYNIPDTFHLKIRMTNDGYFTLACEELPGLITEANNGKKLLEMFNDAVLTYYNVPKIEGDIVHDQMNIDGYGAFTLKTEPSTVFQAT